MNLFDVTVPLFTTTLRKMDGWLVKATQHATARKFDPNLFMTARLAVDQFAFARQVQGTCDTAKWAAAKLAGKEGPSHPDTEATLDELRARIKTCLGYLETFRRDDFAGAEDRRCQHAWMGPKWVKGSDYAVQYALPNFYFHATTAYAILRHHGVDVGKMDFLDVTLRD